MFLEDKIKLIKESEMLPKPTLKMLSEKYRIGKSTIGDIMQKKSTYMFFSVKRM
ncbi:hypothetical protein DPMN_022857 [Dreissena polymorpha]|uniref:HTH psq-type domain-containing protein n=1 Tax=Dreissena polymorpha TaxID=45954 RepID=A0A9D4SC28_DREPO|nr:hypothetical protein DPMN_022857 [Dreissena polymorpha]